MLRVNVSWAAALWTTPAAGLDHGEGVDRDVVAAGDHPGPENVEAGDAEGAGQLVEEAGPVPGHHVDHRERAVEVVLPVDHRAQRSDRIGRGDGFQQLVDHPDVQGDFARRRCARSTGRAAG